MVLSEYWHFITQSLLVQKQRLRNEIHSRVLVQELFRESGLPICRLQTQLRMAQDSMIHIPATVRCTRIFHLNLAMIVASSSVLRTDRRDGIFSTGAEICVNHLPPSTHLKNWSIVCRSPRALVHPDNAMKLSSQDVNSFSLACHCTKKRPMRQVSKLSPSLQNMSTESNLSTRSSSTV